MDYQLSFQAHANDLLPLVKESIKHNGKSFLTIIRDNGPDMNPTNYINIFYLGRLWKDLNMSKLTVVT